MNLFVIDLLKYSLTQKLFSYVVNLTDRFLIMQMYLDFLVDLSLSLVNCFFFS